MDLYMKQFSHGTLNAQHLLEEAMRYVSDALHTQIEQVLQRNDDDEMSTFWHEEVHPALSEMSPEGYYFGSTEGDGSDIGWWPIPSDDFYPNIDENSQYTLVKKTFPHLYEPIYIVEKCGTHDPQSWDYRTIINVNEVLCNKHITAETISRLCRYEDETKSGCEMREQDFLTSLLHTIASIDDEQEKVAAMEWMRSNGFEYRMRWPFHL